MKHEKIKVLVPIDFSEYSRMACSFAFNIAQKEDASVVLMHVSFSPLFPNTFPDGEMYTPDYTDEQIAVEMKLKEQEQMDKFSSEIHKLIVAGELPNVDFELLMTEGIPEEEINRWSRHNKPYLIVMGTRGRDQKELDLIGSVTAEVIDTSHVPVFAIPEDTRVKTMSDIHRIAYFTNFDQRDFIGLEKLMKLKGFNDKPVSFIYLGDDKDDKEYLKRVDMMKIYLGNAYPSLEYTLGIVNQDELLDNMESFIKENGVDVLVITTHKRNIFARLFNPSIAHKMVFHTNTPLLIIRY